MNLERLQAQLAIEEGRPAKTYLDTKGILTGGIGHNLIAHPEPGFDRVGIVVNDAVCARWFRADIQESIDALDRRLPWWRQHDDVRQNALLNLCFNMGLGTLLTFKNTLSAFSARDYGRAADGVLNSQYARDVGPHRSGRVAGMIRTGQWPHDIPVANKLPDFSDVVGGVV